MLKFLGQESNLHHSSNQSHSNDNAGSLTCWATRGVLEEPHFKIQDRVCYWESEGGPMSARTYVAPASYRQLISRPGCLGGTWTFPSESSLHFWRVCLQEYLSELFLLRVIPVIMDLVTQSITSGSDLTPALAKLKGQQEPHSLDSLSCSSLSPAYRVKPPRFRELRTGWHPVSFLEHDPPREENLH